MRVLAIVAALGAAMAALAAQPSRVLELQGFRIDRSAIADAEWRAVERRLARQVSIVTSAGVPAQVLAFFRTVPIELNPGHNDTGGAYLQGKIMLPSLPIPENRPVLLHELLHAYHHQVLGNAAPIRRAHQAALQSEALGGRHRGAHFLNNPSEFFAVIGTIYLFGRIQQPPFDCGAIAAEQADFLAFLGQQFGPRDCLPAR